MFFQTFSVFSNCAKFKFGLMISASIINFPCNFASFESPATQAPGLQVISLPPATEVTSPEEDRSRPDIVPVLNNRKFMGDSFNWAHFDS